MTKPAILDRGFQEAIDLCVPAIAKQLGLSKLEVACLYGLPETVTKIEGEARWTIVSKSNRDETYSVTEDHTNPEDVTATCDCQAGCKGLECVHINAWSLALNPPSGSTSWSHPGTHRRLMPSVRDWTSTSWVGQ